MDWLPLPSDVKRPLFHVECYTLEDYDHGDHGSYPDRQGWGPRSARAWRGVFSRPDMSLIGFLQRWLFWGTLEACFTGKRFHVPAFVQHITADKFKGVSYFEEDSEKRERLVIEIAPLMHSIDPYFVIGTGSSDALWVHNILESYTGNLSVATRDCKERDEILRRSDTEPLSMRDYLTAFATKEVRTTQLAMSIGALMEWSINASQRLQIADAMLGKTRFEVLIGQTHANFRIPQNEPYLYEHMLRTGWCPSEIKLVFENFNFACRHFICHLKRPHSEQVHEPRLAHTDWRRDNLNRVIQQKSHCTPFHCRFEHVTESTYNTLHTQICRGCPHLLMDPKMLAKYLKQGSVPLVKLYSRDHRERNRRKYHEFGYMLDSDSSDKIHNNYVAFSHVWADGMGNLERNSLPWCQIMRLSEIVHRLNDELKPEVPVTHFWMDTLCVPPDSAEQNELQTLAIGRMRKTYQSARKVVVLEKWLLSQAIQNMGVVEIMLRILLSPWNRRLWTLQEGALACEHGLLFQFKDRIFSADWGFECMRDSILPRYMDAMVILLLHRYTEIRCLNRLFTPTQRLYLLLTTLKFRSTSVATDEPLCLATMLGLSTELIAQTAPSERMVKFWSMVKEVPANMIFWNTPKRFEVPGLRWAPQSLLSNTGWIGSLTKLETTDDLLFKVARATRCDHGLLTHLWSQSFKVFTCAVKSQFYTHNESEKKAFKFDVYPLSLHNSRCHSFNIHLSGNSGVAMEEEFGRQSLTYNSSHHKQNHTHTLAFVSLYRFEQSELDFGTTKYHKSSSDCLLVNVVGSLSDGTLIGQRVARASGERVDDQFYSEMLKLKRDEFAEEKERNIISSFEYNDIDVYTCDADGTTGKDPRIWCID